jgi:uncharacterized protein (DUF1501 family)
MNSKTHDLSRRRFVGSCCASVGTTGLLSSLAQLRLMGAAASPDAPATPPRAGAPAPDFKALVCLFFAGGNDANNLVVPADNAGYAAYANFGGGHHSMKPTIFSGSRQDLIGLQNVKRFGMTHI